MGKRYFAIVKKESLQNCLIAAMVAGYERDGKVFRGRKLVGYALDYYPEEESHYRYGLGKSIIGDFATRAEAEHLLWERLSICRSSG